MTNRTIAMKWWNDMSHSEKGLYMEGEFKHRHPQSLTGREIEKLYDGEIEKLKTFFEENGFNVSLHIQDNVQCAELEKWTFGGVDMIIWLNPFTPEEFKSYVNDFDIDEQIDIHRQDKSYKNNFTLSQSLTDFTDFHNELKEVASKL